MFLKSFLNLKTVNDNNDQGKAIVMQENECSGSVTHAMDAHSTFLLV